MVVLSIMFSIQMMLSLTVLKLIIWLDPNAGIRLDREAWGILLTGSCAGAGYILCCKYGEPCMTWVCYLILAIYLTVCVITDRQTNMIYDFLQLPAVAAGATLCLIYPLTPGKGGGLIFFALVQYLLFMRLYGRGDGMAFQICSLYIISGGGHIECPLLHMALAFILLGIVQAFRGNIRKNGNLKVPVPFLPYIAVSVLWFL